jgi:hypothetical protein
MEKQSTSIEENFFFFGFLAKLELNLKKTFEEP